MFECDQNVTSRILEGSGRAGSLVLVLVLVYDFDFDFEEDCGLHRPQPQSIAETATKNLKNNGH